VYSSGRGVLWRSLKVKAQRGAKGGGKIHALTRVEKGGRRDLNLTVYSWAEELTAGGLVVERRRSSYRTRNQLKPRTRKDEVKVR